jgi:hypothetical protein
VAHLVDDAFKGVMWSAILSTLPKAQRKKAVADIATDTSNDNDTNTGE